MENQTEAMSRRIAITGPESTGKSWLAETLAAHFQTTWVPEYAREYLARLARPYNRYDLIEIAKGQLHKEEMAEYSTPGYLFCDTELIVIKIWSDVKYGMCDPWIGTTIGTHCYDLYLLCNIDLPWEYDPLREHPHQRQYLFDLYQKELNARKFPYFVVSGTGEERLLNAVNLIKTRMQ